MNANELYEYFISKAGVRFEHTCDGIIAGNRETEVTSAAVCFKATAEVIRETARKGIPVLICHEPVFCFSEQRENAVGYDAMKWRLLDETGITVLRLHDYAHTIVPDYIHTGFMKKMGLTYKRKFPNESLGISRYELCEPTTPEGLAERARSTVGAAYPRIVGEKNMTVRYVCLALGSIGAYQVRLLEREDCDLIITGEIGEVNDCNYLRDLNSFGVHGAMLMLGHCTSEWAGMELMAGEIRDRLGIPTEYIHCGETY